MKVAHWLAALTLMCGSFSFAGVAMAAPVSELPQNVSYYPADFAKHSSFDGGYDPVLSKIGYQATTMSGENGGDSALFSLNRVYLRKGGGRIFAKGGLVMTGALQFGRIYQIGAAGGRYLAHFKNSAGTGTVFYFEGLSESAVGEIAKKLARVGAPKVASTRFPGARGAAAAWMSSVGAADAQEPTGEPAASSAPAPVSAAALVSAPEPKAAPSAASAAPNLFCSAEPPSNASVADAMGVLKVGGTCVKDIAVGMWDATGGVFMGAFHAMIHPIEFVDKVSGEMKAFAQFMGNFQASMGKLGEAVRNLPPEAKAKILCEAAGSIGVGVLITAFSGGTGSEVLGLQIASKIEEMVAAGRLANSGPLAKAAQSLRNAKELEGEYRKAAATKKAETGVRSQVGLNDDFRKAMLEFSRARAAVAEGEAADLLAARSRAEEQMKALKGSIGTRSAQVEDAFTASTALTELTKTYVLPPEMIKAIEALDRKIYGFVATGSRPALTAADEAEYAKEIRRVTAELEAMKDPLLIPPAGGWKVTSLEDRTALAKKYTEAKNARDAAREALQKSAGDKAVLAALRGKKPKDLAIGTGVAVCDALGNTRAAGSPSPEGAASSKAPSVAPAGNSAPAHQ